VPFRKLISDANMFTMLSHARPTAVDGRRAATFE
jgi:hypothetical protein